jgi:hypothetical protein
VAVDEAGDRREPTPVELLDLAVERPELAHAADRLDGAVATEDERVLQHLDPGERPPA